MNTAVISKKLSEKEKDDLLKEILGAEYSSAGNNLPILKSAIMISVTGSNLTSHIRNI